MRRAVATICGVCGSAASSRCFAYGIGTSALQSRCTGGVAGGTYLFALPGSPSACRDGWEEILRFQLDNRLRPCNLVELMPFFNITSN